MATKRALHFVFKVGDRTSTAKFYREVLGMKVGVATSFFLFCFVLFCFVVAVCIYS